jgi:hypothetical protein
VVCRALAAVASNSPAQRAIMDWVLMRPRYRCSLVGVESNRVKSQTTENLIERWPG